MMRHSGRTALSKRNAWFVAFVVAVVSTSLVAGSVGAAASTWRSTKKSGSTPLISRRYHGVAICTAAQGVKMSEGHIELIGGATYTTIIFTNHDRKGCYLNGAPIVQPVSGQGGSPVGPISAGYFDGGRGGYVVLRANGGNASFVLGVFFASSYVPTDTCAPAEMTGITIRFSALAYFYARVVDIDGNPVAVCSKITTTSVTGIARGVVLGP